MPQNAVMHFSPAIVACHPQLHVLQNPDWLINLGVRLEVMTKVFDPI